MKKTASKSLSIAIPSTYVTIVVTFEIPHSLDLFLYVGFGLDNTHEWMDGEIFEQV